MNATIMPRECEKWYNYWIREIFWLLPVLSPLLPVVSHFSFVSTWKRSHFSLWFQSSGSPEVPNCPVPRCLGFVLVTDLNVYSLYHIVCSTIVIWWCLCCYLLIIYCNKLYKSFFFFMMKSKWKTEVQYRH